MHVSRGPQFEASKAATNVHIASTSTQISLRAVFKSAAGEKGLEFKASTLSFTAELAGSDEASRVPSICLCRRGEGYVCNGSEHLCDSSRSRQDYNLPQQRPLRTHPQRSSGTPTCVRCRRHDYVEDKVLSFSTRGRSLSLLCAAVRSCCHYAVYRGGPSNHPSKE